SSARRSASQLDTSPNGSRCPPAATSVGVPPSDVERSTRVTRIPARAAERAASIPAGPPPTTNRCLRLFPSPFPPHEIHGSRGDPGFAGEGRERGEDSYPDSGLWMQLTIAFAGVRTEQSWLQRMQGRTAVARPSATFDGRSGSAISALVISAAS